MYQLSVSWFWIGAKKDRRTRFSVLAARKMERERKYERVAPFFTRSLSLVPRSLLRNRTETLATQTKNETA